MPTDADSSRAPTPRPLPANPNLEFERKRAKKLLRSMRETNPEAKLTDAQFAIAREYGFLGWPLLVQYFQALERQQAGGRREGMLREHAEEWAQGILRQHQRRVPSVGLSLAAWVPRFFGRSPEEALDAPITLDEARLVTARQRGAPSWDALLAAAKTRGDYTADEWKAEPPEHLASRAVYAHDLAQLQEVCEAHPEILSTNPDGMSLLRQAIVNEWWYPSAAAAAITEWLVARGGSLKAEATRNLMGLRMLGVRRSVRGGRPAYGAGHGPADYIKYLLSRGADPNWLPPSGVPILENALIFYWSGAAVNVLAQRVTPRKAFWIAAGLGDVQEVRRYFERNGTLRPAARRLRPDFAATSGYPPTPPGASDAYLIFEAGYIAVLNQRFAVVDLLLEHGLDLDADWYDMQLLGLVVANPMVDTVEYLISHGADPLKRGRHPAVTALDLARRNLERGDPNPEVMRDLRRIYDLCGGRDADEVRRRHAERTVQPELDERVAASLQKARAEAAAASQSAVRPLDLFVALLRDGNMAPHFVRGSGADMEALQRAIGPQLDDAPVPASGDAPPLSPALRAAIEAAITEATRRKVSNVTAPPLIVQLVADETGEPARLITGAGGSLAKLRESLGGYDPAYRD